MGSAFAPDHREENTVICHQERHFSTIKNVISAAAVTVLEP